MLYGGTYDFVTTALPAYGISYDFISPTDDSGWTDKLRENTRAVYVEVMSNPLRVVPDLEAVVRFARVNRLVSYTAQREGGRCARSWTRWPTTTSITWDTSAPR